MSLHLGERTMKKFHYQQKKTTRYYFGQIIELKFNLPLKKPRESGQKL